MKLTIVPHNTGRVREFRVNNFLLFLAGLVVTVSFIDRYSRAKTASDPEELAKNNKYLDEELKNYQGEYRDLTDKCNVLLSLTTEHQSVNTQSTVEIEHVGAGLAPAHTIDELLADLHKSKLILENVSAKLYQSPEVAKFTPSIAPVDGYVIQSFGNANYMFTGEERVCQGVDFVAPVSSKVYATAYGVVKFAGTRSHSGLTVEIEHVGAGLAPAHTFITKYSHLSLLKVSKTQVVKRGEVIGFVGTTGKTIGPTLHYEVWVDGEPKDPVDFILTEVNYF